MHIAFRGSPDLSVLDVPIVIEIVTPVFAHPNRFVFGVVSAAAPVQRSLRLSAAGLTDFEILHMESDLPFLRLGLEDRAPANRTSDGRMRRTIVATIPAGSPLGRHRGVVRIKTSQGDIGSIPVTAWIE